SSLVNIGNTVYFTANDGTHGEEIWKTDGALGNAVPVTNLPYKFPLSVLSVFQNAVYFRRLIASGQEELWRIDGTNDQPNLVGTLATAANSPDLNQYIATGDRLYFINEDPASGAELWATDGTAAGT